MCVSGGCACVQKIVLKSLNAVQRSENMQLLEELYFIKSEQRGCVISTRGQRHGSSSARICSFRKNNASVQFRSTIETFSWSIDNTLAFISSSVSRSTDPSSGLLSADSGMNEPLFFCCCCQGRGFSWWRPGGEQGQNLTLTLQQAKIAWKLKNH